MVTPIVRRKAYLLLAERLDLVVNVSASVDDWDHSEIAIQRRATHVFFRAVGDSMVDQVYSSLVSSYWEAQILRVCSICDLRRQRVPRPRF